jgi:nucleoside-diphosphate-sugar epimerase
VVDIAASVLAHTGSTAGLLELPMRPGEPVRSVVKADTSTLAAIGIDPTTFVSLTDGIAETVAYYRTTEGKTWQRPS